MESNPEGGEYAGSSLLEHLDHFLTISNLETLPLILNLFELEINLAFWSLIMSFNAWLLLPFIVVLMLIGASALVSGSEIAYFSLSPQQIKALQSDQNPANERILKLLENPSDLLATILIANNVFNIGIILCSHYLTSHLLHLPEEQATLKFLIEIVGITFILVLFGEVMPKVYATHYNARLAAMASRPLKWLYTILAPASRILARSTAALERKIDDHRASDISKQEINQAIDIVARGKVQTQDITMLKGIVGFGDLQVKQIMCSRMDMFAVDYELNFEELKEAVIKEGFSRVPVYKADADHIEGILYLKDLLKSMNKGKDFAWQELIRP
ncbi:MAG: CNNM domain-containing protein, partial [Chitinophagales bacterium]